MKNFLELVLVALIAILMTYGGAFVLEVWGVLNVASEIMWFIFVFAWAMRLWYLCLKLEDKE